MASGRFVVVALVLFAGAMRGWSLWTHDGLEFARPAPELVRSLCDSHDFDASAIASSSVARELGVQRVSVAVFDPDAAVLLVPGPDGRPGKIGVDDDADGVVDNSSELGAMYSDDLCLSPADDGYWSAIEDPAHRVVSRGAFVSVDDAVNLDTVNSADREVRLTLFGSTNGTAWQQLVVE